MKRLNLPLILDTLFAGICAFLLFFTVIRFYTKNAVVGLVFGLSACVLFGALGFLYISNPQDKKLLALHLSLSSDDYIKNLLKKCLGEDSKIRGKRIICGEQTYFFDFKMQPLSEDDVAKIIKYKTENEKIIFCTKASPEAHVLAENFLIKIKGIDAVYPLLKDNELLPEKYVYEGAAKTGFFKKVKARFTRKLCAPLFWSGAALLALSYFTYFPIYYIVSGSVMIILAAAAMIFGKS